MHRLHVQVALALALGIVVGAMSHELLSTGQIDKVVGALGLVTTIFLRLIKMIIAPLVLATLIGGIAHAGSGSLGRLGGRTLAWFIGASIVSLSIGLLLVNLLQPGVGSGLALPAAGSQAALETSDLTLAGFVEHLVPSSIFQALAANAILQIVVFAILAGVALAQVGPKAAPVLAALDVVVAMMLKITAMVMRVAPFAVFAAVAAVIAVNGLGVLAAYGQFIGGFYLGVIILWALLFLAAALILGAGNSARLARAIREPVTIAFSTASSEAAYPQTMARLEAYGVPPRVAAFVLPLGYSFNLDGSMMYCSFAILFIAQAYGIELSWVQQATMLLLLMVTSKGMAGVPRASLVVIASTLTLLGLPAEGLLLIIAVDQFLDMGRSATNVIGNAIATAVVAKWEPTESLQEVAIPMPVKERV